MSFEFKTELFGLEVQVDGYFEDGEDPTHDCPGCEPEYHIDSIIHKGEGFEIDSLPESSIIEIIKSAFDAAIKEAENNADEWASELAADRCGRF